VQWALPFAPFEFAANTLIRPVQQLRSISLALLGIWLATAITAQEQGKPAILELQTVEGQLAAAKQATGLSEGERTEAVDSYTKAIEAIKKGEAADAQAKAYIAAKSTQQSRLTQVREQLALTPSAAAQPPQQGAALVDLEQSLAGAEDAVRRATATLAGTELQLQTRAQRQPALPKLIATSRQKLAKVSGQLEATAGQVATTETATAKQLELKALLFSLEREAAALEAELTGYDGNQELLLGERDLAARELEQADKLVKALQRLVQDRRRDDAKKDEEKAADAVASTENRHPILERLAKENELLAKDRTTLAGRLTDATDATNRATERLQYWQRDFKDVSDRVIAIGLTDAMGALLRDRRSSLPLPRNIRRRIDETHDAYTTVQLEIFKLKDKRVSLRSEEHLQRLLSNATPEPGEETATVEQAARELLTAMSVLVELLGSESSKLFDSLVRLDTAERELLAQSQQYAEFVNQRVLWIRSTTPLWQPNYRDSGDAFLWLVSPGNWSAALAGAWRSATTSPVLCALGALLLAALLTWRRRARREIMSLGETAVRGSAVDFSPTAWTIVLTVVMALPVPMFLWLLGTLLQGDAIGGELAKPLGHGLRNGAMMLLGAEFFRQVTRPGGLAEMHFGWHAHALRLIRHGLLWLVPIITVATILVATHEQHGNLAWKEALGRPVLLAAFAAAALFFWRVLHPHKGVGLLRGAATAESSMRTRRLWFALGVGLPTALFLLSVLGYHFTTVQLALRAAATIGVLTALLILNEAVLRALVLARRKLAKQQALKRRKAAALARAAQGEPGDDDKPIEELGVDLSTVADQTRSLVSSLLLLCMVVGAWAIWIDVLPALGIFRDVGLWDGITLADALFASIVFVMTFLAARNIPGVLQITLLQKIQVHAGERHAITTIARYAIILIGVVYGFSTLGLGWGKLQWLAAGISVGLGFGLQEIFANFVSGLIILFERPIRVGDLVTVNGVDGYVTRIKMRATTIRDYNRKEMVVPNKEFVTGSIVNWTLTDATTRLVIKIGIAYGADTELATKLLLAACADQKNVLETPKPKALFTSFGESSLDFQLRVFIANMDYWPEVIDGLHRGIDKAFRKAGIEIAFPQRDLHLRSVEPVIELSQRLGDADAATK
jgi:potassium efflux system protein